MTNGDKFMEVFGLYATELWAKSEDEFLEWLNTLAEPERKTGEWVLGGFCSCCGLSKYYFFKMVDDKCTPFGMWNFCPNCGYERWK